MRQFGNTARWFTILADDSCLWLFKHELSIMFGDILDDWLLDGLRISSFTGGILASLWVKLQVTKERGLRTSLGRILLALLK